MQKGENGLVWSGHNSLVDLYNCVLSVGKNKK